MAISSGMSRRLAKIEERLRAGGSVEQQLRERIFREYQKLLLRNPDVVEFLRVKAAGNDAELCDIPRQGGEAEPWEIIQ